MAVSKRLRYEILRRDNHTCRYCGRTAPTVPLRIDHVVPVALGGTDVAANLVTACEPCNSGKSSSAPDANRIASATDDQLRWSLAMKRAAEEAATRRSEMDDYRATFRKEWDAWTSGGKPSDLPDDWTITMDRFHNAGLPAFMWDEIVTKAMTNKYVDDLFKYVCGIAWNKVTELHDAARKLLPESAAAPTVDNEDGEDGGEEEWTLLGSLLPSIGQQRYEQALTDIREAYEDQGLTESEISEQSASTAVWIMSADVDHLERQLRRLLTLFPAGEVLKAQKDAESTEQAWFGSGFVISGARLWTSTVERFFRARADAAVLAMTPAEIDGWMRYAATAFDDAGNPNPWGAPTEESLLRRAGEAALTFRAGWQYAGMCGLPGDDIETCPRRAKTQISFPGCSECGIQPAPPEGVDVCSEHFELVLAGEFCQHDNVVTERRDG